jgi:glycosyltransferase involved in cell wall biosynthesis
MLRRRSQILTAALQPDSRACTPRPGPTELAGRLGPPLDVRSLATACIEAIVAERMARESRKVSVIVPVRDGAADIAALLACLERQTLGRSDFEIIIGDDGSTDGGTTGIATEDGHIRVAHGPPSNSYAARNRAVAVSGAPVLAFCDADCRPEPEWLERGLAALAGTDIVAGRIRFTVSEPRTAWTLVDMDGSKDHEHQVRVGLAETANLFLRRELFDQVGGLDGSIPEYGDYEFVERCVAAGSSLSFGPDAVVWHPTRSSARSLLRALWKYNRGYAVHAARAGNLPDAVKLRSWVPLVQTVRSRRRWGRSLGPDRKWLRSNGVEPTLGQTIRALPIMYLVVPYLRSAAQLQGWLEGRRLRRAERQDIPPTDTGAAGR